MWCETVTPQASMDEQMEKLRQFLTETVTPQAIMDEQMEKLRQFLTERYHLVKEHGQLLMNEPNIIDPERYLDCISRLEIVKTRLHYLKLQIPLLHKELCAKRNISTPTKEVHIGVEVDTGVVSSLDSSLLAETPSGPTNDTSAVSSW